MSEELWRPSLCRPPKPGEREAWLKRSEVEREELWQGRREAHEARLAEEKRRREEAMMTPVKPGASRFTTQAAIDWGRAQGWRLRGREQYDFRLRRHHDLLHGMDCLFEAPGLGLVAIQGAGVGEKAEHQRRFDECGGGDSARAMGIKCVYLEFRRGDPEPVKREDWS